MRLKIILFIFIYNFINFFNICYSEKINEILVSGNNRIQTETILEYGDIKKNKDYSIDELNISQKKIYETGFFKDINLILKNDILTIKVIENPIIAFFNLQGEKSSDELNKLYDSLKLGSNKIFSQNLLDNDLNYIKNYYLERGYGEIEVIPRISELEDNKINILININKNEQTLVNNIYFLGNKIFDTKELKLAISSTEYGWWKFLSSSTYINISRIEYDKQLLKKYYIDNGYYDAQISSVEVKKISPNRSNIIFSINAGDFYNFGVFKISEGENFISVKTKNDILLLEKKYLKKNYSKKQIQLLIDEINKIFYKNKIEFLDANVTEVKNNRSIDILLAIKPVNKYYISKINITGNSITEGEVVRRNLLFSEGDSYLDYKLIKSKDLLLSLNIFKKVDIKKNILPDNKVEIDIIITEQPTGSISASAGIGGNGGVLGFGVNEANFLGKGISLNNNLNLGTQKIEGRISAIVPDFNNSDKTLYSSLYSTKTMFKNTVYDSKKTGIDLATRYEIYENLYFKPGIGIDYEKIDVQANASSFLKSQDGNYLTNILKYNLERDERDKKFKTRNGYVFGFSQEFSTPISDVPFIKNSIYASNYFPIFANQNLNIKYGLSNIFTLNNENLKLSDRLFLPYNITKGFAPRAYGPKDLTSGEFIGGDKLAYSLAQMSFYNSFEETLNLNTSVFINAFDLWGTDKTNIQDSNSIRSAIGISIDWTSPIGPVGISLAKTISKESTDSSRFFSFELGTTF